MLGKNKALKISDLNFHFKIWKKEEQSKPKVS